jgi:fatty acid desaturase
MHMKTIWTKLLPENMSRRERHSRVVVGAVLVGLAIIMPSAWGWIGLLPLLTGIVGSCPLYRMLRIQRHDNLSA